MRLAFSTNAYAKVALLRTLRGIRAAGFEGVEILADAPHAYPDTMDAAHMLAITRQLDRLDLEVSNVNCNTAMGYWKDAPAERFFEPSLISPKAEHRAERIRLIEKAMQFAADVGCLNISIASGRMIAGVTQESAARHFGESLKNLLDEAERLGVDVGVECEPGLFIEFVAELREWIGKINNPRLGANLDVGHCQVMGESIPESVKGLHDRIWNVHVEDIAGRKNFHLIPGEGTLDWKGLCNSLRSIDYERFLTVELNAQMPDPQAAAESSYKFMVDLLAD
jgi:fructoselysine 3-epimerase